MRVQLGLLVLLLQLSFNHGQDYLTNCRPAGDETFLCSNRKDYCTETLELPYVYETPDVYCDEGEMGFYDPNVPCNCAILCIKELKKGDVCQASMASTYPDEMCGYGLTCVNDEETGGYFCGRNADANNCISEIAEYEEQQAAGTLGPDKLYPNCDKLGQFGPKQCSTSSTCYCTDTENNRLFGEAVYSEGEHMDCGCSRYRLRNTELGIELGLRCTANGNIDSLQCNDQFCYCYNSTTSVLTQGPVPKLVATELDCYDDSYHSPNYTTSCLKQLQKYESSNPESDDFIVEVSLKPICGLDGHYDLIQPYGAGYYCSDKQGNIMESFQFKSVAKAYSNCNCASRRHLMTQAGLLEALPECCPNGNFKPYQTRGLFSYCVDENGNQLGDALAITDVDSLPCYNDQCPES